ncbi:MAG: C25 family cysteine peptidase [bacterium]
MCNSFQRLLVLQLLFTTICFSFIIDIPLEHLRYSIEDHQGYNRIILENGIIPETPGAPEIPLYVYTFSLSPHQRIKEVRIINCQWQQVPGDINLYPVQKRTIIGQSIEFMKPDSIIYSTSAYYPQNLIAHFHSGNLRGYSIGQILFSPFRYNPVSKRLEILKRLNIDIATEYCASAITPIRQTTLSRAVFNKFFSLITGTMPVVTPQCNIEENPGDLTPTELPSLLGPPVDLVIITTEQTSSIYEEFARFKRLLGFNTVIKTLSWIKQHYDGVDDAERIRNFIKDAVVKWGVSFVLLGNDVPEIPTRWVWIEYVMGNYPAHITTDLYFSDLDKNWNFDGDDRFGEVPDSIDLYPDVLVGRIPAQDLDDVEGYLNKIYSYIFDYNIPPNGEVPYYRKSLFTCSKFISEYDSYYMAQRLSGHLPPTWTKNFLYEKSKQDYINAIYDGFNIITFLAHGDVNLMRVRTSPREFVTNFTYDSLSNTVYPLMVVITCYAGPFQEDCLGEHWVMNPHGGGIGFIGLTSSSVAYDQEIYMNHLFDALFNNSLAGALAWSKIPLIPASQFDNWTRVLQYSLNLLGDPTLNMWQTTPHIIDSISFNKDTLHLGQDTVIINIFPRIDTFFVIFYKENELFIKDTGFTGVSFTTFKINSGGFLKYTILTRSFIPYIDSIYVENPEPHIVYHYSRIVDSSGNNNGIPNPDETIDLYLGLINNGNQGIDSCKITIAGSDSFITILIDTASYGQIPSGEVRENISPLKLKIAPNIPDKHSFILSLTMNYNSINYDTFQIIVESPVLSLFGQRFRGVGNLYKILPFVENQGHFRADSVYAKIEIYSDTITILDSIVYFPTVQPGAIIPGTDSFTLQLNDSGSVCYKFSLYYLNYKVLEQKVVLDNPPGPDSLWSFGTPNSIVLNWRPVYGAIGYRIYRATNPLGPFDFVKNPLSPIAHFEDLDVQHNINYYYYLTTVDSSMNEGVSSDTICAKKNPMVAQGWPRTVYGYLFSSPNFGDLDPSYPGLEITVCSKNGMVYVWHCDGTPAANNPEGIIFETNSEIWSSPAIGDVNNDGSLEICFGIRRWDNNLYVLTNDGHNNWIPLQGWPKSLSGGVLGSPVLADIDGDGDLEIFVITENGTFYAFHHNGEGCYSPDGLLKNLYGWHGGSPAIGDINDDGDLEIVACGGSNSDSIFVWDRYGNYLPPFPVAIARKMSYSPVLGDIIGNSNLEICFYTDSTDMINVIDAYGNMLWQNIIPALGDVEAYPVIADVVGNGRPEIICGSNQGNKYLSVFDSLGNMVSGFPVTIGHDYKLPIVSDVDDDSIMDIVCGAADWNLYGFNNSGVLLSGFPIHFGIRIEQSPAVFDIDNDGRLELMIGANDFKFWVFDLDAKIFDWPKFRYDPYNSGCYRSRYWSGIEEIVTRNDRARFYFKILPNPFKNHLVIKFQIPDVNGQMNSRSQFYLKIYDASGRLVKSFNLAPPHPASSIVWSGDDDQGRRLPAGVYFVQLEAGDFKEVKKAVLVH